MSIAVGCNHGVVYLWWFLRIKYFDCENQVLFLMSTIIYYAWIHVFYLHLFLSFFFLNFLNSIASLLQSSCGCMSSFELLHVILLHSVSCFPEYLSFSLEFHYSPSSLSSLHLYLTWYLSHWRTKNTGFNLFLTIVRCWL